MFNYLVKIKDGPFINRLGIIISHTDIGYNIFINYNKSVWINRELVEFLYEEPQFNQFGFFNCNWCGIKLKSSIYKLYKTNKYMYYCPNCLR